MWAPDSDEASSSDDEANANPKDDEKKEEESVTRSTSAEDNEDEEEVGEPDSEYEEEDSHDKESTENNDESDQSSSEQHSSDEEPKPKKKKKSAASKKIDDETREFLENSNYLRRSGRQRIEVSAFQSEQKDKTTRRKRKNSDEDQDSEGSSGSWTDRRAKKKKKQESKKRTRTTGKTTTRTVTYKEDSSDGIDSDDVLEWEETPETPAGASPASETIEKVLKHRYGVPGATGSHTTVYNVAEKGDPNTGGDAKEKQFLVKWVGWAHIHNTWESESSIAAMGAKGVKKIHNYLKKLAEIDAWRKTADKEYIEYFDCEQVMSEELYEEYLKVERVVAHQVSRERRDDGNEGTEYLVKWCGLPYSECTWEEAKLLDAEKVEEYHSRIENTRLPSKSAPVLKKRPKFVKLDRMPEFLEFNGQQLRDYQLESLNWMLHAWCKGNSSILADEMGLGKTIQSISFLSSLSNIHELHGPFLVVVPLSTMAAWQKEFSQWAPSMNVVTYMGDVASREQIRQYEWYLGGSKKMKVNAILTTYEILLKDKPFLGGFDWAALLVDEAHRLKNDDSLLYKCLSTFHTDHRLLITGTPLQNSLKELWALLHFIMPNEFEYWEDFERAHAETDHKGISSLHKKLEPYLLRRVKKDVEKSLPAKVEQILRVDMTAQQKQFYKWILTRNYKELSKGVKGSINGFVNLVMELKKCCNHSSLVRAYDSYEADAQGRLQQLLKSSGKLILLDKLLCRLKETGHRVLIFSQMVMMLDILQEYLQLRRFNAQRLDGSMRADLRKQALDHFNAEGSTDFCFLLSTRAGGLGINLATADTVIIFDSDWNPQNDLQAMSRAHRIGQKKQVNIYRLVTRGSVEEEIVERAKRKLVLDHLVIQRMDTTGRTVLRSNAPTSSSVPFDKHELSDILKFGAAELFKEKEGEEQEPEVDIDRILMGAETRECEESQENGHDLLNAFKYANFAIDEEKDVAMAGERNDWDNIIPEEQRKRIEEEERERELRELELAPRQRTKVQEEPSKENEEASDSDDGKERKKRKKAFGDFSTAEIKRFVRSIKKFARPTERLEAIAQEAELEEHGTSELQKLVEEFLEGCRKAVEEYEKKTEEDKEKEKEGNKKDKGPTFKFAGVEVHVRPVQKMHAELEPLHVALSQASTSGDVDKWRLAAKPRPQKGWDVPWSADDDSALLRGIHKYGAGSYESIKMDPTLSLADKIFLKDKAKKPQPKHLQARVDYLLKLIGNKKVNRQPKEKVERKRDEKKRERKEEHKTEKKKVDRSDDKEKTKNADRKKEKNNREIHDLFDQLLAVQLNRSVYGAELDDAAGSVFKECVKMMRPVQKYIKRLSEGKDEKETAKCITRIGDNAREQLEARIKEKPKTNVIKWYNYLWIFLAKFCSQDATDLLIKYRELAGKHKHRSSSDKKKEETKEHKDKKEHKDHKDHHHHHSSSSSRPPKHNRVSSLGAPGKSEYRSPLKAPSNTNGHHHAWSTSA